MLGRKPVNQGRQSDMALLAPFVREAAENALEDCWFHGYMVYPFETYRSPERQNELYMQGRVKPGKIVTYARAWESAHGYGLALDCVFKDGKAWLWDKSLPWDRVHKIFEHHGFSTLKFELVHFEMLGGMKISELKALAKESGMQAVWDAVAKFYK